MSIENAASLTKNQSVTEETVQQHRKLLDPLFTEIQKVMVGQQHVMERMIIGLLVGGHVLLEGVPGLAKTLAARTLAGCLQLNFHRIQFTPDLLPADIVGTQIYNPRSGEFTVKKGPIFANMVLADEINRAPAKVQSALLEAMQERQVTIGEATYLLPKPFLVLATQNPIEQEGTYPLAEAQTDRFLMKIKIPYPSPSEEQAIIRRMAHIVTPTPVTAVLSSDTLATLADTVDRIFLHEKIEKYIVDLVHATRRPGEYGLPLESFLQYGSSPRGTIGLVLTSKAHAFLQGKNYVSPHDVKSVAGDVLRHRLLLSYEAEAHEMSSDQILEDILKQIPIP
ncbi:MAG TPA: MoxR family ATPase [Gemmatales bacterium]|nr:MoxR family ATPase [Gemmatales bacterium]HMP15590.1 MoxR family ATPase [Gemmatales bacterium]